MKKEASPKKKKSQKGQSSDIKDIFRRIRHRDFSGYTGLAVKNSIYQILTTLFSRVGSLMFTILLARILLPDIFGLYSLALSTIVIFSVIAELGTSQALIIFVSKNLARNKPSKAKAYLDYFSKIKISLILLSVTALLISSKFIADNFYNKPIFLALLGGGIYILFRSGWGFLESIFYSVNRFKELFFKEILFQILRLIIVPLTSFLLLKSLVFSESTIAFSVILLLSFVHLVVFSFLLINSHRSIDLSLIHI